MSEFTDMLPEDLRESEHLKDIPDVATLAKSYHEAKSTPLSAQFPEDIRESEHLKDIPDIGTLAKSYNDLKSSAPVVPEAPDKYEFTPPEGVTFDEAQAQVFKQTAHELGLSQAQYEKLMDFDIARIPA